jgi:hypothetical protein
VVKSQFLLQNGIKVCRATSLPFKGSQQVKMANQCKIPVKDLIHDDWKSSSRQAQQFALQGGKVVAMRTGKAS